MNISQGLITKIQTLKTPAIIAISGFGGSGKSLLAKSLGLAIDAPVVGIDSFMKEGAFDTDYNLWEIMDFSRLEKEVLKPFINNESQIKYGHFDPKSNTISESREITNNGRLIVEGVGLLRPELLDYFTYKIWIDCPLDVAISRGKKRDRDDYGSPMDELWDGIWKKNDQQCYEEFKPMEKADYIVDHE
jgi:uridine kinase